MKELLTGNAAIARRAYEYGVTLATGYPGTPVQKFWEACQVIKKYTANGHLMKRWLWKLVSAPPWQEPGHW